MSGIVGIFQRDGAPADRALIQNLTRFLAFRGPDARDVWAKDSVAFGNTSMHTTVEALCERQPACLDGNLVITADARLDCRDELEIKLISAGQKIPRPISDSEFLLHAYAAWGESCVDRLRGDFAFAIWDTKHKTLFCARDHFGIKPFYYADLNDLFIFSNTIDCIRLHPSVSDELEEAAIADFLMFGLNYDLSSTTFRDIRRLPPAHVLSVTPSSLRTRKYWSPPTDGRIRYRRSDQYVEHFQTLLQSAVSDRLRTSPVGILLSGGVDSSSIAATARGNAGSGASAVDLRAFTVTHKSLSGACDGSDAQKVAEFLHIPVRFFAADDLKPFERWTNSEMAWPEPVDDPFAAGLFDQYRMISNDCRVVLSGEGIDNLMHFQMWPYTRHLIRTKQWKSFVRDVPRYVQRRPSPWPGVRRRVKVLLGDKSGRPVFPKWMAQDFARRSQVKARWHECNRLGSSTQHPLAPIAHASLSLPQWTRLFELENVGVTRSPVEVRYPFLDLRIVNYVLAIPPFPWSFEKSLLRQAMMGHLPEEIRRKPKAPLPIDPLSAGLRNPDGGWVSQINWHESMERYVDRSAIPELKNSKSPEWAAAAVRPLCLNFWLQSSQRVRYNFSAEAVHG
jgi:asparagine synthase (glutamine-hydrolysing)